MALEPKTISKELAISNSLNNKWLSGIERALTEYTGGKWTPSGPVSDGGLEQPENPGYEMHAIWLSELGFTFPKVSIESDLPEEQEEEAGWLRDAVNHWMLSTRVYLPLRRVISWATWRYGVMLTTMEPSPGFMPGEANPQKSERDEQRKVKSGPHGKGPHDVPWLPRWYDVDPRMYAEDPLARVREERRWTAHMKIRDVEDVLEEAEQFPNRGWNVQKLKMIAGGRGQLQSPIKSRQVSLERGEFAYWEFHVPEMELSESKGPTQGYNGTWLTLLDGGDEKDWLRNPYPAYVSQRGPHTVFDFYPIPGAKEGLAPFLAGEGVMRNLPEAARRFDRAVAREKKIGLVAKGEPGLKATIQGAEDGSVHGADVDDLDKKVKELNLGTPSETRLAAVAIARERVERILGAPQSAQGRVSGVGTATQEANATAGYIKRMSFPQQRVYECTSEALYNVSWYLYCGYKDENGKQRTRMLIPGNRERGTLYYRAGIDDSKVTGFDNLRLRIHAYSMQPVTREERIMRAMSMAEFEGILAGLPPWVDKARLEALFMEAWDAPEGSGIYDVEAEREMLQVMAEMNFNPRSQARFTPGVGGPTGQGQGRPAGGGNRGATTRTAPQLPGMEQSALAGLMGAGARGG